MAQSLTQIYTAAGLPPFYVRVRFNENQPSNVYSGGEPHKELVLIQVWHLARQMTSDEQKKRFLAWVDSILTPVFEPKGVDWEYFVTETPRDLWKINGLIPPSPGSELEKKWVELNRPFAEKEKL